MDPGQPEHELDLELFEHLDEAGGAGRSRGRYLDHRRITSDVARSARGCGGGYCPKMLVNIGVSGPCSTPVSLPPAPRVQTP